MEIGAVFPCLAELGLDAFFREESSSPRLPQSDQPIVDPQDGVASDDLRC